MRKVAFYTLGCKTNQYETEAMRELFQNEGYETVDFEDCADVYVINTCTVTNLGDKKSRQIIRRAKNINKDAIVAVTGCYAQTSPEEVISIEGVNVVIGTKDRLKIVEHVNKLYIDRDEKPVNAVSNIMETTSFEELEVSDYSDKTRGFIKIQDGCTQFCSYCIIPFARGPVRSRSIEGVIKEVERLVENGYKEVVLTGIHIASYGKDLDNDKINLIYLLERINEVDGLERIRIGSIEPTLINNEFINRAKCISKLCPHYHISLQSGCDETLKRMNRKYNTDEYKQVVELLRESFEDVSITTDIMVGFPGETDQEFEKSLKYVRDLELMNAHVFKYSPRKGTKAERFTNQIRAEIKEKRSKEMINIIKENENKFFNKFMNREMDVLFERKVEEDKDNYEGLTSNYIRVIAESKSDIGGNIIKARLKLVKDGYVEAVII